MSVNRQNKIEVPVGTKRDLLLLLVVPPLALVALVFIIPALILWDIFQRATEAIQWRVAVLLLWFEGGE